MEQYTTKVKYYKTQKTVFYFENPIRVGHTIDPEKVKLRVATRKSTTELTDESLKKSVAKSRAKVYDLAIMNEWDWFITLTFDPKKVNSHDYELVSKKLSKWLNNMRLNNPDMKYIIVPEKHKSGAYHFHGLMSSLNAQIFDLTGLIDSTGRDIYNIGNYKLGFTTATKIGNNEFAVKYVSKYITKETVQVSKNKRKYWHSKNLELPKTYTLDWLKGQQLKQQQKDKEKTTSAKVVQVQSDGYSNSLLIQNINL